MSEFRAFFCLWNGYEEKKAIQLGNTRTSDTSCEGSRTTERKLLADKEKKEREKKKEDQKKKKCKKPAPPYSDMAEPNAHY